MMRTFSLCATSSLGVIALPAVAQQSAITSPVAAAPASPGVAAARSLPDPAATSAQNRPDESDHFVSGGTPADQAAGAQVGLGDIVVTAQRRSENLQRVPIAVNAATGEQLQNLGVVDTQRLSTISPGVAVRTTVGAFQPFVRGVGSSASVVENPVALYIDGVYLPQQREGVRELNDIEQIAVLKGPQGTLFGRNATGGVIQITTRAPSHDFQGEATVRYGNYDTVHGDVYVTGGLTDTVAVSLAGEYTHQGNGWGQNYSTGEDTYKLDHQYGARGKFLFEPTNGTRVTLIGDYINRSQHAFSFQPYPGTEFGFFGLKRPDGSIVTHGTYKSIYDTYAGFDPTLKFHGGGASLTVEQDVGFAKLVAISSYRDGNGTFSFDNSGVAPTLQTSISLDQPSKSYTQELQLLSDKSGSLTWAAGAYYFHYSNANYDFERVRLAPLPGPTRSLTNARELTESIAPFAQADWKFLPDTTLTLGVRYTWEKRHLSGTFNPAYNPAAPIVGPMVMPRKQRIERPTFRAALNHNLTTDVLIYASFNTGFKSGGFNILQPTAPGYLPEKLTAYEIGAKSELFDRRLRLNLAGFYYDYKNIQVNQITPAGQIVVNGAGAELYGLDADIEAQVATGLRLSGGFELLHSEFTSYANALGNVDPATGAFYDKSRGSYTFPVRGAITRGGFNAKGYRLPLAQKFSGNVALDYETSTSIGKVHFNVTANYNGQYYFEADNVLEQKAFTYLNSSLKLTLPGDRFSITAWGANLLNKKVITYTNSQNFYGFPAAYGSAPRTYGITGQARF